jgi:hypothetical protein
MANLYKFCLLTLSNSHLPIGFNKYRNLSRSYLHTNITILCEDQQVRTYITNTVSL